MGFNSGFKGLTDEKGLCTSVVCFSFSPEALVNHGVWK